MKLPRWLLVSLIAASTVALVLVSGWLWVEMPRWTAAKFVAAVEAGDVDTANAMLSNVTLTKVSADPSSKLVRLELRRSASGIYGGMYGYNAVRTMAVPRDFYDLLCGRQFVTVIEQYDDYVHEWSPYASWKSVTIKERLRDSL